MAIILALGRLMQEKSHEFETSQDYTTKPSFIINGCASNTSLKNESCLRVEWYKSGDAAAQKS